MEQCQVCEALGDDRRTLVISCGYDLHEVSKKFARTPDDRHAQFMLLVCKDCRGDFLGVLRRWVAKEFILKQEESSDRNIPLRVDGRIIMLTKAEWDAYTTQRGEPGRKPFMVKQPTR